ncbi:MAG: preprotein translocase subunit YajC [Syntrophaceae bacterium]|jgi:preprotein translocase subunit YajC|nr:preprotein translocase subunit YajC [Syntrophaceae bacterium]
MGGFGGGGGTGGGGDISFIIMMAVVFGIFYVLMIRPQQQKQKEVKKMRENLNHGDMVVTVGGIHGKVTGLTETLVTLEIAEKVRIKISREYIGTITQKAEKES